MRIIGRHSAMPIQRCRVLTARLKETKLMRGHTPATAVWDVAGTISLIRLKNPPPAIQSHLTCLSLSANPHFIVYTASTPPAFCRACSISMHFRYFA
jgi:hypothetical protein